jgi:hypothetical protein
VLEGCSRVGLLITNGEFVADMGDAPTTVLVGPDNKGALRFSNSSFWGPCKQIAKIGGHGVWRSRIARSMSGRIPTIAPLSRRPPEACSCVDAISAKTHPTSG